MRNQICDVINYCTWSYDFGKKIKLYDQIVIKNMKVRRDEYQTNFYTNFDQKNDLRMELIVQ